MRYIKKKIKQPNLGDLKIVKKFTFFPIELMDGNVIIWLEPYYSLYQFREPGHNKWGWWVNWREISNCLVEDLPVLESTMERLRK